MRKLRHWISVNAVAVGERIGTTFQMASTPELVAYLPGDENVVAKFPNPIDRHVGGRIRMRRMLAGISQEKLGLSLGVTFQQIQKYEKGANRVSASRLQQIAQLLDVPVAFFFDGAPTQETALAGADHETGEYVSDFLATSEGVHLAKAFARITNAKLRRRVIDLVEALAEEGEP